MQILLIKRDIRLQQNYAFVRACEGVKQFGKVVPLFVFEPSLWSRPEYSLRHQNFVAECLLGYARGLANCGGELVQANGEIIEVLDDLCSRYPVERIVAHEEVTDSPGFKRDKALRAWAKAKGICILEVEQNNVLRGQGENLPFAQWFAAASQAKVRNPIGSDLSAYLASGVQAEYSKQPKPVAGGKDCERRQRGGREEAEKILQAFFTPRKMLDYPFKLSSPVSSVDGCSRLSPYLAWGVVSHAEVARVVNKAVSEEINDAVNKVAHRNFENSPRFDQSKLQKLQDAARFYLDRLRWRMGYHAHCEVHPETDTTDYFEAFKKPESPDAVWLADYRQKLQAMKCAKTGIPYIDACLRQLQATGYLCFRARSTTANFLCMGLGLHWRDVGEYLASLFLDFDGGAIHWSQMRIASGTGLADSLLVYSVAKQARDFDNNCAWQKRWLPELRSLPDYLIHEIWNKSESTLEQHGVLIGRDYPRAICDPEQAMKVGKAQVAQVRKGRVVEEPFGQESLF